MLASVVRNRILSFDRCKQFCVFNCYTFEIYGTIMFEISYLGYRCRPSLVMSDITHTAVILYDMIPNNLCSNYI